MHKVLTTILCNFIVTLIYIANTILSWRAAFDCMGHGNTCSGSHIVRVHLPCEGTMTHALMMAPWHIYLVIVQWHIYS